MAKVLMIHGDSGGLDGALRDNGHEVSTVTDGVAAVHAMTRELPDVVLIDQDVPMGGLRTAGILHLHPLYGSIPVLLGVTADSRAQARSTAVKARRAGIFGVLPRPYRPAHVLEQIASVPSRPADEPAPTTITKTTVSAEAPSSRTATNPAVRVRLEIRELIDLPTLAPAQQRLITIMSCDDDDVDMDALVGAIQADQGLTMRTMRVARSAYYGFTGDFIRSAITYLGVGKIRQIVQTATVLDVFKGQVTSGALDPNACWEHSVATGLVMQRIARDNKHARHFTAGLLHDVGKLVLAYRFGEYSRAIRQVTRDRGCDMRVAEMELIGLSHTEIGYELCRHWQLPHEIAESVAYHHAPSTAPRHKYLSALVYLADLAARRMHLGDSGNDHDAGVDDPFADKLHIDVDAVIAQKEEIQAEVEAMTSAE
jgi:putative nucleotidyltransferase with HDIG domain